ncbi:MAG: AAA family ATPase [Deltaproteobacteria bacterium CG2_30_66_27]|nr:MAG: AAA family ATPase [Deltaproteobacteria bacterium CG2_30_66_27]PJB32894.1 MAG: AAA family ATPase [Deltaproteobacteria bacterium CG_4_9_14_3_um_filter_65_9]
MFNRPVFQTLRSRVKEPRRFLQVLAGPRQVGKTTLVRQAMGAARIPSHYATADEPTLRDRAWIEQQWDLGRLKAKNGEALLVLDEIQKVPGWSTVVKRLWDEDTERGVSLKCVLLGSSPLLVQKGLAESLAGRFEILHATHWSFSEMRDAFGWEVEQYVYFGGYPGAASLIGDRPRWARYIIDSLIETTISRDILLMTRVDKPALLRRLFQLGCDYSGQILSYQKMLGQLQDAGNTTTLAHYLELLAGVGMLKGISKFSGKKVLQRGSSPKFQVLNTALMTAQSQRSLKEAEQDREYWGRLVESAVGAHLQNGTAGMTMELFYWRDRGREVDFVLRSGERVVAIEVKSGRARTEFPGMEAFGKSFRPTRKFLVGGQGIPLEEFLSTPISHWVE